MKIAINTCYGGFGLSDRAIERYAELAGLDLVKHEDDAGWGSHFYHRGTNEFFSAYNFDRTDPILIKTIEELGTVADGFCAQLKVVDVPDGVDWQIDEYDGIEWVAEKHRTWN